MREKRILIVEDDPDIQMIEEAYLNSAGYITKAVSDGRNVKQELEKESYDLVLLDVMLPGKDGFSVCREIRSQMDIPVLMVTARCESIDKIRGLGSGADDYIEKPFDPGELLARVNANIRQYDRLVQKEVKNEIQILNISIQLDSHKVYKDNQEIKLANKEFELLKFLVLNHDIVFSKEQLLEKIWGYNEGDNATVMVHINRIREKIEEDPKNPKILETVWGAGYRLNKSL